MRLAAPITFFTLGAGVLATRAVQAYDNHDYGLFWASTLSATVGVVLVAAFILFLLLRFQPGKRRADQVRRRVNAEDLVLSARNNTNLWSHLRRGHATGRFPLTLVLVASPSGVSLLAGTAEKPTAVFEERWQDVSKVSAVARSNQSTLDFSLNGSDSPIWFTLSGNSWTAWSPLTAVDVEELAKQLETMRRSRAVK